jgi:hypothetical protein
MKYTSTPGNANNLKKIGVKHGLHINEEKTKYVYENDSNPS